MQPLVSMVVPSWQQGRYLRATLESLVRQTYHPVEILVRDNCSTDETPAILDEYASHLAAEVREKDAGQSDALRKGFAVAKGDILGWLNSDDMLYPETIAEAVTAMQTHPEIGVVHGHATWVGDDGQFLRYVHESQPISPDLLFNCGPFISQPCTFFRRNLYEQVGGLDPTLHYGMDWDLWCRFARAGARFQLMPRVWAAMRIHPAAKSLSGGGRRLRELHGINRRYTTKRIPWTTMGLAYGEYVRRRMPWLDRPLGGVWSFLSGQKGFLASEIEGFTHPAWVVRSPARIRVPRYGRIRGAMLRLSSRLNFSNGIKATLNGLKPDLVCASGTRWEMEWTFDDLRWLDVVEVSIEVDGLSKEHGLRLRSFTVKE